MHGRLKVRTTEDERERKKKEQALKVKAYKSAMQIIAVKRQKEEYDDEMMQVTKPLLLRAPDIATLWNVRKECILEKVKNIKAKAAEDTSASEVQDNRLEEEIQKIFDDESLFTEQCLPASTKSYCTWYQRCWLLENAPRVNWNKEILLCRKYLTLDERNFHTWDYLRYLVEKADIPKDQELDFSLEKIKTNFSNYSSWHHRSLYLPLLYPYKGEAQPKRSMSEEKLREELEMVLTAVFTDPNDSSAWFYQRWLLGHSRPDMGVCAFRANTSKAVVAFTKPLPEQHVTVLLKTNDDQILELNDWKAVNQDNVDSVFRTTLKTQGNDLLNYKYLQVHLPQHKSDELLLSMCGQGTIYYFHPLKTSGLYTSDVLADLKVHLASCQNLLEYEPGSKWTLLTSALLMQAIDAKEYHSKCLEYLKKLQTVDQLRANYYKDLAAKWTMENVLNEWSSSKDMPLKLDLSDLQELTTITQPQYLCIADEVILSEKLKSNYANLNTFQNI